MQQSLYPIAFCAYASALMGAVVTLGSIDKPIGIIAAVSTLSALAIGIISTIELLKK